MPIERDCPSKSGIYYDFEYSGAKGKAPDTFVISPSARNPEAPMSYIEVPVAETISEQTGRPVTNISIFSYRDENKYELVIFKEVKNPDNSVSYTQDRSLRDTHKFTRDEVDGYLNKHEREQQEIEALKKSEETFQKGKMDSSPKAADAEEVAAIEKKVDERGVAPNHWFARQDTGMERPNVSEEDLQTLEQQQEQTQGKKH